jgi:hypothetical protein
MVEAQQRAIAAFAGAVQIDIPSDAPTIQARKMLAGLIEAERFGERAPQTVEA